MSERTTLGSLVLDLAIVISHDLGLSVLAAHDGSLLACTDSNISLMHRRLLIAPTDSDVRWQKHI